MIARLRGELLEHHGATIVVDVHGVGYEVQIPESAWPVLPELGGALDLYVRQVFREDGVSLFGFVDPAERRLFDLLTEVKGCGPKIGLSLIGQVGAAAVAEAILRQDAKTLALANGVGPRLAERLILELKDKVQQDAFMQKVESATIPRKAIVHVADDLVDALLALGYRRQEAESAAAIARDESDSVEEQLKTALRSLQR
ncbi:MAG: Holliday junction ATP-dependent DNA helicase RuvA [Fimbriimonadaceae bacterium]|nr:Holliday junction ATP-dependent DNA helicase RuvA [Fimbriimonadaceae bacterium]